MANDDLKSSPASVPVCGIGASAGGVEALQHFFSALRPDLGLAYVVILHLAPDHKSELPGIIGRWTTMPVIQVGDHDQTRLAPDHVYVIAPDRQLVITDMSVSAVPFDQPRGQRTAIDSFFRSLAASRGDRYAVLLSGTGTDGAIGAKAVKEQGGLVLVQDPNEAAHGAMPRAAIATGAADLVLPARDLALQLADLASSKHRAEALVRASESGESPAVDDEKALKSVFDVLRKKTGHDFSKYKRTTVLRRLSRRMQLVRQLTIAEYLEVLRTNDPEVQALFNDLLISVTTFFRDPDAWAALATQVVDPLVERADSDEQLRIWIPGCATGEEAYTVAILFCEAFERRKERPNFTIFASDVDESALAVAREGLYPHAISADISDSRLERYFRAEEDHFRVLSEVRDHVVFATHSVLRDPPFAKLHLVSCRNVLIYLDRELQEQMMSVFQYACRDDAFLFLGESESADEAFFQPVDKRYRIFAVRPREGDGRPVLPDVLMAPAARLESMREARPAPRGTGAEVHLAALEEAAPPSIVVDERGLVLHVSPSASLFFQQGGGPVARHLTDLVRPELRDEVHAALQRALEGPSPELSAFVLVTFNGAPHKVAVPAQPRLRKEADGRWDVLVTFLDAGEAAVDAPRTEQGPATDLVRSLREELRQAERRLANMRDDQHLTTEDLRAANEELQSLNEEYRSTTEELETSKEELQSINEELHTVNHELKIKLDEVSRANADLENLMAATNVATVFLTPELRIKRFTPQLAAIYKVQARDVDRPIGDLKHQLDYDVEDDARRVLATSTALDREAVSLSGRAYMVRVSPYRTAGGREVDGVVATFIDVTALEHAKSELRQRTAELEANQDQLARQADDLRQQDRHREEFLAALGHELRNPMAAIQNALALFKVPDDERSRRAVAVAKRQMRHMTRLVNDLLDVTRVKHGRMQLQRASTDVARAACAALETVRERAEAKGVQLRCDVSAEPVYIMADGERLAQILDNLVQNALTYTDTGVVSIALAKEEGVARITVSDTGIGLTPEDLVALFEPYRRVGDRQRGEGLGLGLTLVKALVEAHGGSITAQSDGLDKGSRFAFTMPLATSAPTAKRLATVEPPPRRRILVVDDEADVADMFGFLLKALGQDVAVAHDGASAIELARQFQPHVAFLDVTMPGMSGAETARLLRKTFSSASLTLVAVTGHDKTHGAVQAGEFDRHLLKPATAEAVVALLNALPLESRP